MRSSSSVLRGAGHRLGEPVRVPVFRPHVDGTEMPLEGGCGSAHSEDLLSAARAEAEQIVARARQEAEQIRTNVAAEREQVLASAQQEGWQAGYNAGYAEGMAASKELVEQAQQVLEVARGERRRLLLSAAPALVKVAMASVRRILGRELAVAPANVERIVSEMLQFLLDSHRIEVRVHPSDYVTATEARAAWRVPQLSEWEIAVVPDSAITPGGCEIRGEAGRIDARLETKLELLESALTDMMERSVREYVESVAP